jgi:hypothetical protein
VRIRDFGSIFPLASTLAYPRDFFHSTVTGSPSVEGPEMKRTACIVALLLVSSVIGGVVADPAAATTPVAVRMTFAEAAHPNFITGCAVFPEGFCGSGEVIPFGQATETVAFGAGCGGTCDLRMIVLHDGTLTLAETAVGRCLGACGTYPVEGGYAELSDTVVAGTGIFAGATGTLTGTVRAAVSNARPAGASEVQLSGRIQY